MNLTRRDLIRRGGYAGAGVALADAIGPFASLAEADSLLSSYASGMRMAGTPAFNYRAYRSKAVTDANVQTWVQLDLGRTIVFDTIQLFPASERMFPGRDQYYAGEGFPLRFRIEASRVADFTYSFVVADLTHADFPDPGDQITQFAAHGAQARYVRLTATRLRTVKVAGAHSVLGVRTLENSPDYTLSLSRMVVISAGAEVSVGCKVSADNQSGNPELLSQLTRPPREDGEEIQFDHPHFVTDPATWTPVRYQAQAPRTGVTLAGGLFETAMRQNIDYLLNSYSTDELLRQFFERTGKIKDFKATGSQIFWEEDLAGSNAGRFLMGAGNTLRWIEDAELRRRLNAVVDGIAECRQSNGYIMAYPEDTIFFSERAAYTRAWLTHGLLEAAYCGNQKALPLLRGYYDWFNRQGFLPEMLRGAIQGGQGMIANTRVALSAVGKPADAQVIQRYYQEVAWLRGLARREKDQIWQYPYDRPHCYLLTNLEAYLDMYLLTGDALYHDAVLGAWELYRAHWQQAGGSISIIEFKIDPPDSNLLSQKLGELCGSSFWVFLSQRFQLLHPDEERYAAGIEKSIYNVAIANQDGGKGLRYHTNLEGTKEASTRHNSCCEGQGTRLLGSLPEHIYSIAEDGLYVHLYEPSTVRWQQGSETVELKVNTRFPFDTRVQAKLTVAAPVRANLRIRVPSWAAAEMPVTVNGNAAGVGKPGTYLALNRAWSSGDTLEFVLPAAIRVKRYNGADQIAGKTRYSVEYGPILLAALGAAKLEIALDGPGDEEHLAHSLEPMPDAPLHFTVRDNPSVRFVPYWQIVDEEFTCYPAVRATSTS